MNKTAVKILAAVAASLMIFSGCTVNIENVWQSENAETKNNSESVSEKQPENKVTEKPEQTNGNPETEKTAEAQVTESEAQATESEDSENVSLPLDITVNGQPYKPESDGTGITYASANGATAIVFGGINGNEAVLLSATIADQLVYNGSKISQSDFGQNAIVEALIIDIDTQAMCAGTTVDSTTESYIENAVVEIKDCYSDSDSRKLQVVLSCDFHSGGESYKCSASGTADYNAEMEEQLKNNAQVGDNHDPHVCSLCGGSGVCYYCHGRGIVYTIQGQMTCVSCNGDTLCRWCHGKGTL